VLVTREIVKPFKMHSMLRINVENIWELNLLIHLKISIPSSKLRFTATVESTSVTQSR
jgi:hypothetical protein